MTTGDPGKKHFDVPDYPDWIFRYDSQPDRDYGLRREKHRS
jgi:hypothetical protein